MLTLADLRLGDECELYEVVGYPQQQADGTLRIPVRNFADPWAASFVSGDAKDEVVVLRRGGDTL